MNELSIGFILFVINICNQRKGNNLICDHRIKYIQLVLAINCYTCMPSTDCRTKSSVEPCPPLVDIGCFSVIDVSLKKNIGKGVDYLNSLQRSHKFVSFISEG